VHIDEVPTGVVLAAGMTATVEIDDRRRAASETKLGWLGDETNVSRESRHRHWPR
jgi:hypothetical protein